MQIRAEPNRGVVSTIRIFSVDGVTSLGSNLWQKLKLVVSPAFGLSGVNISKVCNSQTLYQIEVVHIPDYVSDNSGFDRRKAVGSVGIAFFAMSEVWGVRARVVKKSACQYSEVYYIPSVVNSDAIL